MRSADIVWDVDKLLLDTNKCDRHNERKEKPIRCQIAVESNERYRIATQLQR